LYVTLYLCHSFTSKHRSSLVRYNVCANHLLVNAWVVLYVMLYLCQSFTHLLGNTEIVLCVTLCVNHLLTNTGIVWYFTLYLHQSFTGQYRSSIVHYIVCVNHLLGNTEVALYITLYVSITYWEIQK
jgi:hypothetical protein